MSAVKYDREKLVKLWMRGLTAARIAEELGVKSKYATSIVYSLLNRLRAAGVNLPHRHVPTAVDDLNYIIERSEKR